MLGVVIVATSGLARGFHLALEDIVGHQGQLEAIDVNPETDIEQCRNDILEAIERVDTGEGAVVLTDMFGGTPSNLAISVMSRPNVEVVAGVSLPSLVKLMKIRDELNLAEAATAVQDAGRKYLTVASRILGGIREEDAADEVDVILEQRPAAFRFGVFDGKIDSLRESNEVLDTGVAQDLREEVLQKAALLFDQLTKTNSDPRVLASIDRLIKALGETIEDVRPGVLLSRSRSIESDRNAFDSQEGRRELFPGAISLMDDVLLSLQDLLATFPVVREIEAERLALAIQADARMVGTVIRHANSIKQEAEDSEAVTRNAVRALGDNDPEIKDARDVITQSRLAADQLLVIRNFLSAVTRAVRAYASSAATKVGPTFEAAGTEIRELGRESWQAIKSNLPVGLGAAASLAPVALLIALLAQVSVPAAGLAAAVKAFKPLLTAIEKVTRAGKQNTIDKRRKKRSKRKK